MNMTPQKFAQYQKAGRGFLITRNSATLADTDYEHIAKEIVDALNKRNAYADLVQALKNLTLRCDGEEGVRADGSNIQTIEAHAILEKYGEL